jgi:hypothetical protein
MVVTLIGLAAGGYGPFAYPPQCHGSRIGGALALGQMLDASLDATDRATCVCETRGGGCPGVDYGNGLYVLPALRQPLGCRVSI